RRSWRSALTSSRTASRFVSPPRPPIRRSPSMSESPDQVPHLEEQTAQKQGLNLSAIAVRERSVTLFFIVLIVCVGILAYLKLGRAEDPKFTVKVFTVVAAWPGATAEE